MPSTILGEHATTLPSGTTGQRPNPASAGMTRYNTTTGSLEFYDGTTWVSTNLIPTVNSVTGNIYVGAATTLTLALTNATENITVRYAEGGSTLKDVAATVTAGSSTTTVPSEVYGQTSGDTISISILNQDGTPSGNAITKTVLASPTGGTVTTSGSYRVHTFTSSGTFATGGFAGTVEYLVVGGGAGAVGHNSGGGGGAGGFRTNVTGATSGRNSSAEGGYTLTASTNYTVTVGAGSAGGGNGSGFDISNGANSVFGVITSLGGGKGGDGQVGAPSTRLGAPGGCGGGVRPCSDATAGSGTAGQGFDGGSGTCEVPYPGGGGGGAGANGTTRATPQTQAGPGGVGIQSSITGTATYYAGGGGGSTQAGGTSAASGGSGGGGVGGYPSAGPGGNGGANTGGGGGAGDGAASASSGNGGSGIVIVRYILA
jgi:hypothetical protein